MRRFTPVIFCCKKSVLFYRSWTYFEHNTKECMYSAACQHKRRGCVCVKQVFMTPDLKDLSVFREPQKDFRNNLAIRAHLVIILMASRLAEGCELTVCGEFVNGFFPFFKFIQGGEEESVILQRDKTDCFLILVYLCSRQQAVLTTLGCVCVCVCTLPLGLCSSSL